MIPVNVLLVEDNPGDARFVMRRLEGTSQLECKVEHAEWMASALTLLRNKNFDIVLLDLSLPDSHGVDTVVAAKREAPSIPIIVLSGQEDLNVAAKAMQAGADNFLVKRLEMTSEEIEREILYALQRASRDAVSKSLLRLSVGRLSTNDGYPPPAPASALVTEHVNAVEDAVAHLRLFLQKNNPMLAEQAEQLLHSHGYFAAMNDLRSTLSMGSAGVRARNISQSAMDAIREVSSSNPVANPEAELLEAMNMLGGGNE